MEFHECNLNIRYDLPKEIWDKVPLIYEKMNGWIGFGKDGNGENGIPYWFSYNENEKSILASVEPSGLQFSANMELDEWTEWKTEFKKIATEILGFKVGELEEGEVGDEIEMTKIESRYKIAKYKNGLPHYGEVVLNLELTKTNKLELIENYQGSGWIRQGYEEITHNEGYDKWKKGIHNGISYAYNKLKNSNGLKVTVIQASGLVTDTNPTILAFASSRAILDKLENTESKDESRELEELMFNSWNYDFDSIPNFEEKLIIGKKLPTTRYKNNGGNSAKIKDSNNNRLWSKLKKMWF
ncbi:hypothetical protein [uncultured Aquimarina sp.]|uniref:hypothetical protein n=1 Tax=uncultured Aquimarina sp. TaxID=575652 RepID=UPI00261271C2|nr:hypothetical protein [uncultured Aquimarina sp.]